MKNRRALDCERLERRELPANSFSVAVPLPDLASAARIQASQELPAALAQNVPAASASESKRDGLLSLDAVGAFFADRVELGRLFPSDESPFESLTAPGWDTDYAGAQTAAPVSDEEFWAFLRNYATKAIRREERTRGPLSDHADIIQQIYVEWREEVQSSDDVHGRVLVKESPERTAFQTAVRRVLDRTRYGDMKQRRRVEADEPEARTDETTRAWADMEIDLAQGVGKLTEKERDILDMRRWGLTFEEIGARLGIPKQRAFEAYTEVLNRLSDLYRD
jgi:DNA-directed RNA polymerase specialized sigma24 family protein